MKGDCIPNHDHIARYIKPTSTYNGEIQASAFMMKPDEYSLSVNWLEYLDSSRRNTALSELRNVYVRKLNRISRDAKIAVLNVGDVIGHVRSQSPDQKNLRVLHDPEENDHSHSGIFDFGEDDDEIARLICEKILEKHTARH